MKPEHIRIIGRTILLWFFVGSISFMTLCGLTWRELTTSRIVYIVFDAFMLLGLCLEIASKKIEKYENKKKKESEGRE